MVPQKHTDSGARPDTLTIPELEQSKAAVLNTLPSVHSRRSYTFAIDRFIAWYCSEPRLTFNRAVVVRYRSRVNRCGVRRVALGNRRPQRLAVDRGPPARNPVLGPLFPGPTYPSIAGRKLLRAAEDRLVKSADESEGLVGLCCIRDLTIPFTQD
jgi:hypothetical protein